MFVSAHITPKQYALASIALFFLLLFAILTTFPGLDWSPWSLAWYTRLVQFYAGSLASLVALVTAIYAGSALGDEANPRTVFITLAFITISAVQLISSMATPTIIAPEESFEAFFWSLRFSFPAGALFFALASIRWPARSGALIVRRRRLLWLGCGFILIVYAVAVFSYPQFLQALNPYSASLPNFLAIFTIALLLGAAWGTWRLNGVENGNVRLRLVIVMLLLAEAQLFQAFGNPGRLSGLIAHPMMLIALIVAVSAILDSFESTQNVQFNRYFAALGSILIGGLSIVFGEFGTRWLWFSVNRTSVFTLVLVQGAVSFLVLYVVVLHLNRLITERTEALRREQHLRSELTQLIVHDLKSPLSVITGGINLLAKGNLGPLSTTQTRLLISLEQSGQQILSMIDDLLDVERIEAGVLQLQMSALNPATLLQESVNDLIIVANTHKQQLRLTHQGALPYVQVDKRLLRRVLNNLLSNALKFTPEQGQIHLHAYSQDDHLIISVADSGPGVPVSDRKRIFEKFAQAQVKGIERRGAGLGLTFCKMVIEAHNGTLSVGESELGGALFKMSLPLRAPAAMDLPHTQEVMEGDWNPGFCEPKTLKKAKSTG